MNSSLRSHNRTEYDSEIWEESRSIPGVRFALRRISLGQRISLAEKLARLVQRHEFLRAGDALEEVEANLADLLVRRLYLEWALVAIEGLSIGGTEPTVELLIDSGPEALSNEIVAAIRLQLELTEDERKNS